MDLKRAKNILGRKTITGDNITERILKKQKHYPSSLLLGHDPLIVVDLYLNDYSKVYDIEELKCSNDKSIYLILEWAKQTAEIIRNEDPDLIKNAMTEIDIAIGLIGHLYIENIIEFRFKDYQKLAAYCGILDCSKRIKRLKNFKQMSNRYKNNQFKGHFYFLEMVNQMKNFTNFSNVLKNAKTDEEILIYILTYDISP